jgi:hypothetical protein
VKAELQLDIQSDDHIMQGCSGDEVEEESLKNCLVRSVENQQS